jgi:hypothetical protein
MGSGGLWRVGHDLRSQFDLDKGVETEMRACVTIHQVGVILAECRAAVGWEWVQLLKKEN